jgi:hypothetical protein
MTTVAIRRSLGALAVFGLAAAGNLVTTGGDPRAYMAVADQSTSAGELFRAFWTTPVGSSAPMIKDDHSDGARAHVVLMPEGTGVTAAAIEEGDQTCLSTRDEVGIGEGCSPTSTFAGGRNLLATIVVIGTGKARLTGLVPDAARDLTIEPAGGNQRSVSLTDGAFTRVLGYDALPVTLRWTDADGNPQTLTMSL